MTQDDCFWCSDGVTTSRDHVFPRNLFPAPIPADVTPITVPACDRHNGAFSKDEEYFRDFVLGGSYRDPDARELWETKTRRALKRSPKYREMLARDVYDVDYQTKAGIHLGKVSVLVGKAARIKVVLRKIVCGLYYNDYGEPLGFPEMGVFQLLRPDDPAAIPHRSVAGVAMVDRLVHQAGVIALRGDKGSLGRLRVPSCSHVLMLPDFDRADPMAPTGELTRREPSPSL